MHLQGRHTAGPQRAQVVAVLRQASTHEAYAAGEMAQGTGLGGIVSMGFLMGKSEFDQQNLGELRVGTCFFFFKKKTCYQQKMMVSMISMISMMIY